MEEKEEAWFIPLHVEDILRKPVTCPTAALKAQVITSLHSVDYLFLSKKSFLTEAGLLTGIKREVILLKGITYLSRGHLL